VYIIHSFQLKKKKHFNWEWFIICFTSNFLFVLGFGKNY